jgi:hypothetical protein
MSDNLAAWAGKNMASGAAGAVGASLFTYGLGQMGISLPGDPSSQLAAIQQTLNQIVGMLSDVENEISELEQEIKIQFDEEQIRTTVLALENLVSSIHSIATDYTDYVDPLGNFDKNFLTRINDELLDYQMQIHNQTVPVGERSLYELYADQLKLKHRFLSHQDTDFIQSRLNYYQGAQYLQSVLLVLFHLAQSKQATTQNGGTLVDQATTRKRIDRVITTFRNNMNAENSFQVWTISPNVVHDTKAGLAFYVADFPKVNYATATASLNLGLEEGIPQWDIPSIGKLIGKDKVSFDLLHESAQGDWPTGIFTGYDSQGFSVSPTQWLKNNGVPESVDMSGLQIWTSSKFIFGGQFFIVDITSAPALDQPMKHYPLRVPSNSDDQANLLRVWDDFERSLLYTDGNAGISFPPLEFTAPVTLKADNGKYLSEYTGVFSIAPHPIMAFKDTPDYSCVFTPKILDDNRITLRTNSDKFLSRFSTSDGDAIWTLPYILDESSAFAATILDNGKVTLTADNGKFLCHVNRGDSQTIELTEDVTDPSCQFDIELALNVGPA